MQGYFLVKPRAGTSVAAASAEGRN